ncbi:MAG: SpoIIE family protein phosphatase [Phycisphaerales bacterium]|jgi:serine phosphatase RsbU (regulator of sigma subunit)/pSer/pThr/pTyr-binding forkhead associated (FHA) protein|nr:SpoIIE family protein phosphatase [Phycisphaeraceae bacterium]
MATLPGSAAGSLRLEPVSGPPLSALWIPPAGEITIGRHTSCQVQLPEGERSVSRTHCKLTFSGGSWFVIDLESRHGTFINGSRLTPHVSHRLHRGDRLKIGPWTLIAGYPGETTFATIQTSDRPGEAEQLITVVDTGRENIHRRRLELLLDCAKRIGAAKDELTLAEGVLDVLAQGTGYTVVAIIRPIAGAEQIDLIAARGPLRASDASAFSRSLVRAASTGQIVRMKKDQTGAAVPTPVSGPASGSAAAGINNIHSIVSSGILTALCVPVMLDNQANLCLYLDSRVGDPRVHDDAAAFCQAVADMCAMALANIRRDRLEIERLRTEEQMGAALDIQRLILPAGAGRFGRLSYAMNVLPGRFVAGDLFDVIPLDEHRTAFFVGDVSGKGVPASIVMATTQSYLNASLRHSRDLVRALADVNRHLADRTPDTRFVSLWLGVLDQRDGTLEYIDAGHGFAILRTPNAPPTIIPSEGGPPLRVAPDYPYALDRLSVPSGSRIILYSDGVVEQQGPAPACEEFGSARVLGALARADSCEDDVRLLLSAVRAHAGTSADALADDVTIASIAFDAPTDGRTV